MSKYAMSYRIVTLLLYLCGELIKLFLIRFLHFEKQQRSINL